MEEARKLLREFTRDQREQAFDIALRRDAISVAEWITIVERIIADYETLRVKLIELAPEG
jgi:hypothetical protein